ncbi:uncharacterized protein [Dermacentor albipictus]|uniref:uncharacterized protein n=1 Tax=Dermacentor albipictus TaxID=60249 RepID=UPI0038FC5815
MAAFGAAIELAFSNESSSSSSSSSDDSDCEMTQVLYEAFFSEAFSEPPRKCPRIVGFVEEVVRLYSDDEFYPRSDRGGSPSKTAEEHALIFLWFAANKAYLRDVASRFGIGDATAFRIVERILHYLVDIAKELLIFPADLNELSADVEQVSGVPNTIGCIDGSYVSVRCPAKKVRSTHVNRHNYPALTLQAVCDYKKRFLDVTIGNQSKIRDSRIFRKSRLAERSPSICCSGKFHVLGDAAYSLRDYLITPFRDYGRLK